MPFAQAHFRKIQALYICRAKETAFEMRARVSLSRTVREELNWWIEILPTASGKAITDLPPPLTINADASGTGWGATCGGVEACGTWTRHELDRHINGRELLAAFKALRTFTEFYRGCCVAL